MDNHSPCAQIENRRLIRRKSTALVIFFTSFIHPWTYSGWPAALARSRGHAESDVSPFHYWEPPGRGACDFFHISSYLGRYSAVHMPARICRLYRLDCK
jgi:hypothetical protein